MNTRPRNTPVRIVRLCVLGLVLCAQPPARAWGLSWRCQPCGNTFEFDSRDSDHLRVHRQNHPAQCPARPVRGFGGSSIPPEQTEEQHALRRLSGDYASVRRQLVIAFHPYTLKGLPPEKTFWSMKDLGQAVARLHTFAESRLAALGKTNAYWRGRIQELARNIKNEQQLARSLQKRLADIRREKAGTEAHVNEARVRQGRLRTKISSLEATVKLIQSDSARSKEAIFARLSQAYDRGVLHPPSAYMTFPAPGSAGWKRSVKASKGVTPLLAYAQAAKPISVTPLAIPARAASHSGGSGSAPKTRKDVKGKLDTLGELPPRLKAEVQSYRNLWNEAETLKAKARTVSGRVKGLVVKEKEEDARLNAARLQLYNARRTIDRLNLKHDQFKAKLAEKALAGAFWKVYDKISKELMPDLLGGKPRADTLKKFHEVQEDIHKLGQDIIEFLPRAVENASLLIDNGASDRLQESNERFGVKLGKRMSGMSDHTWKAFIRAFGLKSTEDK